jgi:hypothetical protein
MGDLSDSSPSVLAGYISEAGLARQLNRSVRTLQRLARPPPEGFFRPVSLLKQFLTTDCLAACNCQCLDSCDR